MEENEEICRVCRSEGTPEQPLFHPCKCSGSIRFVHQECLLEWLKHSNKRYCELCKYNFSFTPIYSPEMPATIPKTVLIRRATDKIFKGTLLILRAFLVAMIWFMILPYFTIWIWRLYFWIGETFAFRANGLETPQWNATSFFASRYNMTALTTTTSASKGEKTLDSLPVLLAKLLAPEYQWISKFMLDCFEGLTIGFIVIVVFVATFLLREWVIQNQEHEGLRLGLNDGIVAMPAEEPEAQGFNVEHAVERLIAVQHQFEAVVEGEADLSDSESSGSDEEDAEEPIPRSAPVNIGIPRPSDARLATMSEADIFGSTSSSVPGPSDTMPFQHRPGYLAEGVRPGPYEQARFFWESEGAGTSSSSISNSNNGSASSSLNPAMSPLGSWPSEGGSALGSSSGGSSSTMPAIRPGNDRTHSSDPTTGIFASTNTLDRSGRRPPAMESQLGRRISFTAPEDIPLLEGRSRPISGSRVGYVYDPVHQTYHPETRWSSSATTSEPSKSPRRTIALGREAVLDQSVDGEEDSTGRLFWHEAILSRTGTPLYWSEGIPLTYRNVYLKHDGTEMTLEEKRTRYFDLCVHSQLSVLDIQRLPTLWGTDVGALPDDILQGMIRAHRQREMVRQINERGARRRLGNDIAIPAAGREPQPQQAPRARPQAAPAAQDRDDEEELDGILEVIGMNGSFWILLQNSLLLAALICSSLGVGVWIPFMLGKTMLLMNPINVLHIPFGVLSRITDPVLDFLLDSILPFIGYTFSRSGSAVLTKASPLLAPVFVPILGPSWDVVAMDKMNGLYQDHVVSAWQAFMEISTAASNMDTDMPAVAVLEQSTQGDVATNATLIQHVALKWTELAYGNTSGDKFAAILIGYTIMFVAASWYFSRIENAYGQTFARMARDALRQQGLILKIAFFIAVENVIFPLFCGIAIGMSTLPVFHGSTVWTRLAFYFYSPNWFIFLHWIVGTAFVINFSMFIGMCRTIVRPGVMWFIKDPNDEGFNPFRENLERPLGLQIRKLARAAFMYLTLITFGVTLVVHAINFVFKGVFPLRWPIDEPISDIPIDLLLFHLVVPLTARWLNPTQRAKILFKSWCRTLTRWMRLSSFLYGVDGQRFPEEEGYIVYRSWKAWILRSRPPIPGLVDVNGTTTGSGEELDIEAPVIFVQDGALYRVPNTDRVLPLKGRRIFVPVDANGDALDPSEDIFGQVDPLAELRARGIDIPRPLVDPKQGTTVVYGPPHFQRRLLAFVFLLWTSVMLILTLALVCPLVVGRAVIMLNTKKQVHDVYCFITGVYFLGGLWYAINWIMTAWPSRTTTEAILRRPRDLKTQLRAVWGLITAAIKLTYFGITFGFILPLALGLMVELYLILPLRSAIDGDGSFIFVVNWAVGLLYMKIIHRILVVMPNNELIADLNRVFVNANVNQWDAGLATRRVILPALAASVLVIASPFGMAWALVWYKDLHDPVRLRVFTQAYPITLMVAVAVLGLKESVQIIKGWSQYVRDEEYLVGRQLHNLLENEEVGATTGRAIEIHPAITAFAPDVPESGIEQEQEEEVLELEPEGFLQESSPRLQRLSSLEPAEAVSDSNLEDDESDDTETPKHFGIRYSRRTYGGDDDLLESGDEEVLKEQQQQVAQVELEGDTIAHRTRSRRRLMVQERI